MLDACGDQQFMLEAMEMLTSSLRSRVSECGPEHVGLVLWACTQARYYDPDLADTLLTHGVRLAGS